MGDTGRQRKRLEGAVVASGLTFVAAMFFLLTLGHASSWLRPAMLGVLIVSFGFLLEFSDALKAFRTRP